MKKILGLIGIITFMASCGNTKEAKQEATTMKTEATEEKTFAVALVNNKKDPTCGMPVSAGIHDTLHYENHVLGFCSTECKNEAIAGLQKNPKAILDSAIIQ